MPTAQHGSVAYSRRRASRAMRSRAVLMCGACRIVIYGFAQVENIAPVTSLAAASAPAASSDAGSGLSPGGAVALTFGLLALFAIGVAAVVHFRFRHQRNQKGVIDVPLDSEARDML